MMMMSFLPRTCVVLLFVWIAFAVAEEEEEAFVACDEDSVSSSVPVSSLTPNTFHKICADQPQKGFLGSPQCGDGSPYGFFIAKPPQKKANKQKLLIEFSGGGACWDQYTCNRQEYYLTFPEYMSYFPGRSCTELQAGIEQFDTEASMLCARKLGDTDLTGYNSIIVPYCTQDVHTGDATNVQYDDLTVQHTGAHNLMSVMRYIYKNFPNPSHIVITGCSAGGTALPLAYTLLQRHYNHFALRSTQISVIADSPVYLTPSYFLENVIDSWNPWTLAKYVGFDYSKYKYDTSYSTIYLDYILKRGSNKDQWGFVGHVVDPISEIYYTWMSGNGDENERRRLEDNDNSAQWWTELTESLSTITNAHKNVDTFWIDDSEGHCTFGLYYPLLEDGFEEWAANIVAENSLGHTRSLGPFVFSAFAGCFLVLGIFYAKRQSRSLESGEFLKYDNGVSPKTTFFLRRVVPFLHKFAEYPITATYMFTMTMYFWIMICAVGFAHPLNNPALGPSAIDLSAYGINNPSLIVYQRQVFRLLTSSLLCSGVLTWFFTMLSLWFYTRPLEKKLGLVNFGALFGTLALGANLIYALVGNGASCSSLALALGLNFFSIILRRKQNENKCMIVTNTVLLKLLAIFVFSFNSWAMIASSVALGLVAAFSLFDVMDENPVKEALNDESAESEGTPAQQVFVLKKNRLYTFLMVCATMLLVLLLQLRKPNELYLEPFYTGCDLKYSDAVGDLASGYFEDRRRLAEDEEAAAVCAQFCVPHLVSKGASFGAQRVFDFPLQDGKCADIGYENHIADKTFNYFSYSLDVEVYEDGDGDVEQ